MSKKHFNEKVKESMIAYGWHQIDAGSGRQSDYNKKATVFVKERYLREVGFTSLHGKGGKPCVPTVSDISQKLPMEDMLNNGKSVELNDDLTFITSLRQDCTSLVLRCDSFFNGNPSIPINYTISVIKNNILVDLIFFPLNGKLPLSYIIGRTLDYLQSPRYYRETHTRYKCIIGLNKNGKSMLKSYPTKSEAEMHAKFLFYKDGKYSNIPVENYDKRKHLRCKSVVDTDKCSNLNITLLFNKGTRFIASLDNDDLLTHFTCDRNNICELNDGIFSSQAYNCYISSYINNGHQYIYPLSLNIRDIVNHTPDGFNDVFAYSDVVNYPCGDGLSTFVFKNNCLNSMPDFLHNHTYEYLQYTLVNNDSILLYSSAIYGLNKALPCTLLSANAKNIKNYLCHQYNWNEKEFEMKFNGMQKVSAINRLNKKHFNKLDCITTEIKNIHRMAADSFSGGYNHCPEVVMHKHYKTYDIDANNGYPTIMSMLPLVDWSNPVQKSFHNVDLTLEDFSILMNKNNPESKEIYPFIPMFCYVSFEFPDDNLFPNLGVRVSQNKEDITDYPLRSNEEYCYSGVELYIALKMGAKIHIKNGYVLNVLYDEDGSLLFGFQNLMKDLITERNKAIKKHGKKSLYDHLLKLLVNSFYGKTAQGVKDIADDKEATKLGVLSNPVVASMTTAGMRSLVFAACYEINKKGFHVYSVTTDGLITDCPIDIVESLDLLGLKIFFVRTRQFLTGDKKAKIWSLKHEQEDLYNFTTRGNISLNVGDEEKDELPGVAAFNSLSRPYPQLPKEDSKNRFEFQKMVATRTGKLEDTLKKYPKLKDLNSGSIFVPTIINEYKSMDYDLKRKPVKESLKAAYAEFDGKTYEIAQFATEPYEDKDEFILFRSVGRTFKCLRTIEEWNEFFKKIAKEKRKIKGYDEFSIVYNIIHLHKSGMITIPALANIKSVKEKIQWINEHNQADKEFTLSHWNHCSDPIPVRKQIPLDVLEPIIEEWGSI